MFSTILSNKKRFRKVKDGECGKRRREEPICHDRTHLLEGSDGSPGKVGDRKGRWLKLGHVKRQREEPIFSDGDDLPGSKDEEAADEEVDSVLLSEMRGSEQPDPCVPQLWKSNDGGGDSQHRPQYWVQDLDEYVAASKSSKEQLLVASSLFTKDVREWCSKVDRNSTSADVVCCGSWRGVKTLLRKQFMPSNLKKDALEDLQLRNQSERGRADSSEESTKMLRSRTNLLELRNMDTKIQDGVTKSSFPNSVKISRVKKHHPLKENLESSTSNKMIPQSDFSTSSIIAKTQIRKPICEESRRNVLTENGILRKLMRRPPKGQQLLAS